MISSHSRSTRRLSSAKPIRAWDRRAEVFFSYTSSVSAPCKAAALVGGNVRADHGIFGHARPYPYGGWAGSAAAVAGPSSSIVAVSTTPPPSACARNAARPPDEPLPDFSMREPHPPLKARAAGKAPESVAARHADTRSRASTGRRPGANAPTRIRARPVPERHSKSLGLPGLRVAHGLTRTFGHIPRDGRRQRRGTAPESDSRRRGFRVGRVGVRAAPARRAWPRRT